MCYFHRKTASTSGQLTTVILERTQLTVVSARVKTVGMPVGGRGDTPFGRECHVGCETSLCPVHTLTWTRGGMETHTHQAIIRGFLTRTLRKSRISHEKELTTPLKEGTAPRSGYLRMDVVVDSCVFFQGKDKLKSP